MILLYFVVYGISFIKCNNFVLLRQKTGDEVYENLFENCSDGKTFFNTRHSRHCIYGGEDIGCYLHTVNETRHIPTLDERTLFVTVPLPTHHLCMLDHTVMHLRYWNYKDTGAVWSTKYSPKFLKMITATIRHNAMNNEVVLRFQKNLPGVLFKIRLGCINSFTRTVHFYRRDCILLKFSGKTEYPLTLKYFKTAQTILTPVSTRTTKTPLPKTTMIASKTFSSQLTISSSSTNATGHLAKSAKNVLIAKTHVTVSTKKVENGLSTTEGKLITNGTVKKVFLKKEKNKKNEHISWIVGCVIGSILASITLALLIFTICKKRTPGEEKELEKAKEPLLPGKYDRGNKKIITPTTYQEVFNPMYGRLSGGEDDVFKEESNEEPIYAKVIKQRSSAP